LLRSAMVQFKDVLLEHAQGLQLRKSADDLWQKAYDPVPVSNNPDVWIRFTPKDIGMSSISSDAQSLTITLMISGRTETLVGPNPASPARAPLPPLRKEIGQEGFSFYLPIFADYSTAAGELKKILQVGNSQTLQVPALGPTQVSFLDVEIYPTTGGALA